MLLRIFLQIKKALYCALRILCASLYFSTLSKSLSVIVFYLFKFILSARSDNFTCLARGFDFIAFIYSKYGRSFWWVRTFRAAICSWSKKSRSAQLYLLLSSMTSWRRATILALLSFVLLETLKGWVK